METHRVNEETEDGNYVIEMFNHEKGRWEYITTEFSISIASEVISNLNNTIPNDMGIERKYIGSYRFQNGRFFGHLFERIN